jgi:lipopolysaccharide biosynthesis regulator YciM
MYAKEIARLEQTKPDDMMLGAMYGQLGSNYRSMDDLANADKYMRKAVEFDAHAGRPSGWDVMLADIERAEGNPKDALARLERAQADLSKRMPNLATCRS